MSVPIVDGARVRDTPQRFAVCRILFVLAIGLGQGFDSQGAGAAETLERIERTQTHMGTAFRLVVYAGQHDVPRARVAVDEAFRRIAELDGLMSNYRGDSEISVLAHSAPHSQPVPISQDLWRVLRLAREVSERSNGAFDVTIGPVTRLWRRARRSGQLPDAQRLRDALELTDYRLTELSPDRPAVRLLRAGMGLDLGGIAKGYAADEALSVVRRHGFAQALVDAGGDLALGAAPPGQSGWRVGLVDARGQIAADIFLEVQHGAVATSGDLWQYVEIDGARYSHIVNPHTGMGLTRRGTVTVVSPDAARADALASAACVLGPDLGLKLVQSCPATDVRFVYQQREREASFRLVQSPGFARWVKKIPQGKSEIRNPKLQGNSQHE